MRQKGTGQQRFVLEDGEQLHTETREHSYRFIFTEEANLFEGARVDLIIGGRVISGRLTAIMQGSLVITLDDDFGETITTCILRLDNTALLQALHDRLSAIEQGASSGFRSEFAERVLANEGSSIPQTGNDEWPWPQSPTDSQQRFLRAALAHDITWLWGPPGTGKTDSLAALVRLLHDANERVLICSNTNQAVDQLLLKLCRRLQEATDPALLAGRILRVGRIEDDLEREFGDCIIPDRVVERRSRDLKRRQMELEAVIESLSREVVYSQSVMARFVLLDASQNNERRAADECKAAEGVVRASESEVTTALSRLSSAEAELAAFQKAGGFRRFFMRSEQLIRDDLTIQQGRLKERERRLEASRESLLLKLASLDSCRVTVQQAEEQVHGEKRAQHERRIAEYAQKSDPLKQELGEIAAKLEDLRNAVLRDATIVGATVTRTFLRPSEFAAFQTVIIDEASMILLPAVFLAMGLAAKRGVIAGDFQQLPPIVQTEQEAVFNVLGHDVFSEAGIAAQSAFSGSSPRHVMLSEQFRMNPRLCQIVSRTFYGGALATHPAAAIPEFSEPLPLTDGLTIVDTSRVWPFTTRDAFGSRLNLMHALAVRNLVLHMRDQGRVLCQNGKGRIGVCSPYAAQAKLIRAVLQSHGVTSATVRVATAHGFQGDERSLLVLDLVDSIGERNAGIFLQANQLTDSGAKLLNVALSRAREGIVIIANLTFLDRKLPSDAILRGVLFEFQRSGKVSDVHEILRLRPIADDLRGFDGAIEIDPEAIRSGLFRGPDFERLCRHDLKSASQSIVVFSGFVTPDRVARLADVLRERVSAGVRVRCVTRPPHLNGSIPEELGKSALQALEGIGVTIDLRSEIHEKVIVIDSRIVWFGSLNPLSHTHRTSELMARVDDRSVATHLAGILAVRRRSPDDFTAGAFAEAENPRCEVCGGWSVLVRGRFGPFFRCSNGDNWKCNLDVRRRSR